MDDYEIDLMIQFCLKSGFATESLPKDFVLPDRAREALKVILMSLDRIIGNNRQAQITLCMGFVEGFRCANGAKLIDDVV